MAASLRVPGVDSDDETKTPSPSPHHGRSRPPSLIADSSSESDEGDARGEVRFEGVGKHTHAKGTGIFTGLMATQATHRDTQPHFNK